MYVKKKFILGVVIVIFSTTVVLGHVPIVMAKTNATGRLAEGLKDVFGVEDVYEQLTTKSDKLLCELFNTMLKNNKRCKDVLAVVNEGAMLNISNIGIDVSQRIETIELYDQMKILSNVILGLLMIHEIVDNTSDDDKTNVSKHAKKKLDYLASYRRWRKMLLPKEKKKYLNYIMAWALKAAISVASDPTTYNHQPWVIGDYNRCKKMGKADSAVTFGAIKDPPIKIAKFKKSFWDEFGIEKMYQFLLNTEESFTGEKKGEINLDREINARMAEHKLGAPSNLGDVVKRQNAQIAYTNVRLRTAQILGSKTLEIMMVMRAQQYIEKFLDVFLTDSKTLYGLLMDFDSSGKPASLANKKACT